MTNTLQGKAALVTGGSQGLGRALGQALAAAGARVVLAARNGGPLAETVAAIRAAGGEAHAVVGDVGAREQTAAIAGQAAALVGPIELLVNNASTLGPQPLRLLQVARRRKRTRRRPLLRPRRRVARSSCALARPHARGSTQAHRRAR